MLDVVSLETARRLQAVGFPQDQWEGGQLIYSDRNHENDPDVGFFRGWELEFECSAPSRIDYSRGHISAHIEISWYAAPSALDALTWLEERGLAVWDSLAEGVRRWVLYTAERTEEYATAEQLLDAILSRLEGGTDDRTD